MQQLELIKGLNFVKLAFILISFCLFFSLLFSFIKGFFLNSVLFEFIMTQSEKLRTATVMETLQPNAHTKTPART